MLCRLILTNVQVLFIYFFNFLFFCILFKVEDIIYPSKVATFGFPFEIIVSKRSYILVRLSPERQGWQTFYSFQKQRSVCH